MVVFGTLQYVDMLAHATTPAMADEQQAWLSRAHDASQVVNGLGRSGFKQANDAVNSLAQRQDRVILNKLLNAREIIRIPGPDDGFGMLRQGCFFGQKADTAFVIHKAICRQQMLPTGLTGAQAEIVFLAITFAEGLCVKNTNVIQAGTANIHAETNCR